LYTVQSCNFVSALGRLGEHGLKNISASKLKSTVKPSNVFVHVPLRKVQRGVGRIQKRRRLGAEQVMSAAGRLHTGHGGSAMRIYASHGTMNFGKTCDFDVARVLSSHFYTFNMMDMRGNETSSFLSIKQCVVMVLFPMLLSYKWIENVIIGGWSLVSVFAFHAALELEASISGPCAGFAFDSRMLPHVGVCHVSRNFHSISRENRASLKAHSLVHFMEVPHF